MYIVQSNSTRNLFVDRNIFDVLLEDIVSLQSNANTDVSFVLLGDLNSRVGEMSDYILHDNHNVYNEHILPDDYRIDVPIARATQDRATNANGYLLIDFLKHTCLKIANGRVCSDKHVGSYTCVGG